MARPTTCPASSADRMKRIIYPIIILIGIFFLTIVNSAVAIPLEYDYLINDSLPHNGSTSIVGIPVFTGATIGMTYDTWLNGNLSIQIPGDFDNSTNTTFDLQLSVDVPNDTGNGLYSRQVMLHSSQNNKTANFTINITIDIENNTGNATLPEPEDVEECGYNLLNMTYPQIQSFFSICNALLCERDIEVEKVCPSFDDVLRNSSIGQELYTLLEETQSGIGVSLRECRESVTSSQDEIVEWRNKYDELEANSVPKHWKPLAIVFIIFSVIASLDYLNVFDTIKEFLGGI